jgi:hypothetical protein
MIGRDTSRFGGFPADSSDERNGNGAVGTADEGPKGGAGRNGRDSKGRFAKGNSGGPGNPFAANVAQLRKAALKIVTPKEMEDVFRVLLLRAKTGNLEAMKLLFLYTLGKPAELILSNCR